jgi:hypothetical protein
MEARDKALELIEMFKMDNTSDGESRAIKCAILCVDEIQINLLNNIGSGLFKQTTYWNKVRAEIQKY